MRVSSPGGERSRRLGARLGPTFALALLLAGGASELAARDGSHGGPGVGTFLIARENLPDPNFFETVVLLIAYDSATGAAGVVINRRSEMSVGEASGEGGPLTGRQDDLYLGGPVGIETLIVLLRDEASPEGARAILEDVHLVEGREGLDALHRSAPEAARVRFYAGYAGWAPGQLEDEISRGVWYLVAGESRRVFSESPEEAWGELIRILLGPRA